MQSGAVNARKAGIVKSAKTLEVLPISDKSVPILRRAANSSKSITHNAQASIYIYICVNKWETRP